MSSSGKKRLIGVQDCFVDAALHTGLPDGNKGNTAQRDGLASVFLSLALGGEVSGDVEFSGDVSFTGTVSYTDLAVSGVLIVGTQLQVEDISAAGLIDLTGTGTVISSLAGTISVAGVGTTTLNVSGASALASASFSGAVSMSNGLAVSSGTSALHAMTATTGAFAGAVTMDSTLRVTGKATIGTMDVGATAFSGSVTMGVGTTIIGKAISATAITLAGDFTHSSGTANMNNVNVAGGFVASGDITARSTRSAPAKQDSETSATLDISGRSWVVLAHTGGKRTVTAISGGIDGQEIEFYNSSADDFEIAAGKMVSAVALTIAQHKACRVRYSTASTKFYRVGQTT